MTNIAVRGTVLRSPADGSRVVTFRASTPRIDRHGTKIVSTGIDTREFDKNPIFAWGHDATGGMFSTPDMDHVIGRVVNHSKSQLAFDIDVEFVPAEVSPKAERAFQLVKKGFLNAVSIGFIPTKWHEENDDSARGAVRVFDEVQLLEISLVPVPSNADCVALSRHFFGGTAETRRYDLEELEAMEVILRAGAVLNRANKAKLTQAATLVNEVLATAAKEEQTEESDPRSVARSLVHAHVPHCNSRADCEGGHCEACKTVTDEVVEAIETKTFTFHVGGVISNTEEGLKQTRWIEERVRIAMDAAQQKAENRAPEDDNQDDDGVYIARKVKPEDAKKLAKWATDRGIKDVIDAEKMHVTVVYSRADFPADELGDDDEEVSVKVKGIKRLKEAIVLTLDAPKIVARHKAAREKGASHDFKSYQPHISLSYAGPDSDLPDDFPSMSIKLGPEFRETIKDVEDRSAPPATTAADIGAATQVAIRAYLDRMAIQEGIKRALKAA